MAKVNKIRILCLHGYKQYDVQFKNRTNALRKCLKNMSIEFHYVTAIHKIPFDVHLKQQKELENKSNNIETKNNDDIDDKIKNLDYLPRARAWWRSNDNGTKYDGIEDTLKYISDIFKNDGPFDGILGFSQGGVLCTILCLMRKYPKYFEKTFNLSPEIIQQCSPFHFAWIISGFLPRCNEIKPLLKEIIADNNNDNDKKNNNDKLIDDIPLLLVYGKEDQYVSPENVLSITQCFKEENVTLICHKGGHYIPAGQDVKGKYIEFLSKM